MASPILETAPASDPAPRFDAVVFAGGGCRCFWQAGFWREAAPSLGGPPRVVGAVSAGAAMACGLFAGGDVMERVLADFMRRTAANRRNLYLANWLRGKPVFPHEAIYRATLSTASDGESLARLHRGPDIRVLVGRAPTWAGRRGAVALAYLGESAERAVGGVHARFGRRLGFEPEIVSVRECRTPEDLVELILHSSCTPPALPFYRRGGRPVLDGGIVDAVPVEAVPPAHATLVLLSRRYERALPAVAGRHYVQPSAPVPASAWDYTSPQRLQATWELGRRDGARFAESLARSSAA